MSDDPHLTSAESHPQEAGSLAGERVHVDDRFDVIGLLITLGEHKALLIALPATVIVLAIIVSLLLPVSYTATTTFLAPQPQQSAASAALQQLGGLASLATGAGGVRRPDELYVAILRSDTIQNALIDRFGLMQRYGTDYRVRARSILAGSVDISADKSGLLKVEVTETDAVFAAQLANAHVEELRNRLTTLAVTDAQQRRAFFEQQLVGAKNALVAAEIALKQTQESTGLIALDKQGEAIIRAAADLRAQIVGREVQLQAMRNYATPQNAVVQKLESEIAGYRAELAKMEAGQVRGKGDVIVPTGKVPEAGLAYVRALREVKYHEAIFELLARQFEMAKLDEAREAPLVQQIDPAVPPELKSKPKRSVIVMSAAMVSMVISVMLILALAEFRKIRSDPRRLSRFEAVWTAWLVRGRRR